MGLQIVSFEQEARLKALGFDWKTTSTPTVALALQWIRKVKNYHLGITTSMCSYVWWYSAENGRPNSNNRFSSAKEDTLRKKALYFDSYEEAENSLLDELLDVLDIKNKVGTFKRK